MPLHLARKTITRAEALLIEARDAAITHGLDDASRGNTGAKCAAEAAPLDLAARQAGLPLCDFLGRRWRDSAPRIAVISGASDGAVLEPAQAAQAQGFRPINVKLGLRADPREDAAPILRLRRALGPGADLPGDANMAWTLPQTRPSWRTCPPERSMNWNNPCRMMIERASRKWAGALPARSACPIYLDEGLHKLDDFPTCQSVIAGFGLKFIKLGGLLAAKCAARVQGRAPPWPARSRQRPSATRPRSIWRRCCPMSPGESA